MATRKITKKKTAQAKPKRPYKRRKIAEEIPMQGQDLAEVDNTDMAKASEGASEYRPSNQDILQCLDAIDVREMPIEGRFQVLAMLRTEGYLRHDGYDLFNTPHETVLALNTTVLLLQHRNRLVTLSDANGLADLRFVSVPHIIAADTKIGFDYPNPGTPEVIEVHGRQYVRVGFPL